MATQCLMTGARPTGSLHLGQYLSAFRPFVEAKTTEQSFFVVSDLHMLTTRFDPASTRSMGSRIRALVAQVVAMGVDPAQTNLYLQSSMPWQARFYVILQSLAVASELERHGSFAEMARASGSRPSLGLLGYPVLESSDVLAIGATHVTVGRNNVSHFEHLSQLLDALREGWGVVIEKPQPVVGTDNMIGLDGGEKMSKSLGNAIYLDDAPDVIARKIKGMAPFAADGSVIAAAYLEALGAESSDVTRARERITASGAVPADVEQHLTELVVGLVDPIRRGAAELLRDPANIDLLLVQGTMAANQRGEHTYRAFAERLSIPTYA